MGIEELSIGDWVYYRTSYQDRYYPMKVVGIKKNSVYVIGRGNHETCTNLENIHPIPITSQLLLNWKFREVEEDDDEVGLCTKYYTSIDDWKEVEFYWRDSFDHIYSGNLHYAGDEYWKLNIVGKMTIYGHRINKPFYVHEFQQWLRSSGLNILSENISLDTLQSDITKAVGN